MPACATAFCSPDPRQSSPLSGRKSTYRTVRFSWAGSVPFFATAVFAASFVLVDGLPPAPKWITPPPGSAAGQQKPGTPIPEPTAGQQKMLDDLLRQFGGSSPENLAARARDALAQYKQMTPAQRAAAKAQVQPQLNTAKSWWSSLTIEQQAVYRKAPGGLPGMAGNK